jgi:hypothetical protein
MVQMHSDPLMVDSKPGSHAERSPHRVEVKELFIDRNKVIANWDLCVSLRQLVGKEHTAKRTASGSSENRQFFLTPRGWAGRLITLG